MRRVASVCVVSIVVLTALLLDPSPGDGCQGGCHSTPFIGTGPCLLGHDTDLIITPVVAATLDPETDPVRPLCLIEIMLPSGRSSDSYVLEGETDTFYVLKGDIEFGLNDYEGVELDVGFVRVVPGPEDSEDELLRAGLSDNQDGSYKAELGDGPFTLSTGSSIYLDNQQNQVALSYAYVDDGEGESVEESALLISSAPPPGLVGEEATPVGTPEATPGN